jgi:hypothetical protein
LDGGLYVRQNGNWVDISAFVPIRSFALENEQVAALFDEDQVDDTWWRE